MYSLPRLIVNAHALAKEEKPLQDVATFCERLSISTVSSDLVGAFSMRRLILNVSDTLSPTKWLCICPGRGLKKLRVDVVRKPLKPNRVEAEGGVFLVNEEIETIHEELDIGEAVSLVEEWILEQKDLDSTNRSSK